MKLERQLHILIGLVTALLTTMIVSRLMQSLSALPAAGTGSTTDSLWLFVRESADALAALGVLVITLAGDLRTKVLDLVLGPVEEAEEEPTVEKVPEDPVPTKSVSEVRNIRRRRK